MSSLKKLTAGAQHKPTEKAHRDPSTVYSGGAGLQRSAGAHKTKVRIATAVGRSLDTNQRFAEPGANQLEHR